MAEAGLQELATNGAFNALDDRSAPLPASWTGPKIAPEDTSSKHVFSSAAPTVSADRPNVGHGGMDGGSDLATRRTGGGSALVTIKNEGEEAIEGNTDDGERRGEGEGEKGGRALEGEEWAIVLALFSSNLCFATEGPGRVSDFRSADRKKIEEAGRKQQGEEVHSLGDEEDVTIARYLV